MCLVRKIIDSHNVLRHIIIISTDNGNSHVLVTYLSATFVIFCLLIYGAGLQSVLILRVEMAVSRPFLGEYPQFPIIARVEIMTFGRKSDIFK